MNFSELAIIMVGKSGRYLLSIYEPADTLYHMLRSADVYVGDTVAKHIINGNKPLAKHYKQYYCENDRLDTLVDDLAAFVDAYLSVTMLREIQRRIRKAVAEADWSPAVIDELEQHYVGENASREQIALYVARVMYTIFCQDLEQGSVVMSDRSLPAPSAL